MPASRIAESWAGIHSGRGDLWDCSSAIYAVFPCNSVVVPAPLVRNVVICMVSPICNLARCISTTAIASWRGRIDLELRLAWSYTFCVLSDSHLHIDKSLLIPFAHRIDSAPVPSMQLYESLAARCGGTVLSVSRPRKCFARRQR